MPDIASIAASVPSLKQHLEAHRYICSDQIATAVYLAYHLRKPVLIEGPPGVGKTELAKTTAEMLDLPLIRLQCYEGLDVNQAVYEWNYTRQMLHIRLLEARGERPVEAELFSPEFLLKRPLLQAIEETRVKAPVLLIDEVDRSDEEFEAFLLEVLSDFQITIPEIGTLKASQPPFVVLTSNRTREVHDALKRRGSPLSAVKVLRGAGVIMIVRQRIPGPKGRVVVAYAGDIMVVGVNVRGGHRPR